MSHSPQSASSAQASSVAVPTVWAIFGLAWPLAFNALFLQGNVIIDTYLVTRLGENAVAAMGIATALAVLLLGGVIALSQATQLLVAQAHGAGSNVGLKSALMCAISIGALIAALGLIIVWGFAHYIFMAIAPTPQIAADALAYIQIFSAFIVCEVISQAVSCHFNGTGRTHLPFYSQILGMPINIGISILLIFGLYGFPELGLSGAAIGSVCGALVRLIFLSGWLLTHDQVILQTRGWEHGAFWRTVRKHLAFTLPVATTFFGLAACNSVCAMLYAQMSVTDFAAMTLIVPWIQVVGMMMIAWSQASGILLGQLLGARASDQVLNQFLARGWRVILIIAAGVSLAYLVASLSFPYLYTDLQQDTLDALWSFVPALLILTFPKSSNAMCGTTLRAGGDTVAVMNIHLGAQWLYRAPMTALFILVLDWPVTWVFALFFIEELLKFPLFHLRFRHGAWRRKL